MGMKTKIKMQFDPDVALDVGVDCAIMFSNIEFWVEINEKNKQNFHNDKYWMYNSASSFCEFFPFWTEKQIRRILKTLASKGYIEKGNFNKKGYDRTGWYTCPNGKFDVTERSDESDQMVTPIPDIKPDIKQDTIPTQPEVATDWDFEREFDKLRLSIKKNLKIVALYWHQKGWEFENKAQYQAALKRDLVAASQLVGYSGEQISQVMDFCQRTFEQWSLFAVVKQISNIINKK
jgi:hypothetical protein